jgi:hypothetical protein
VTRTRHGLEPRALAPLFVLTALIHGAALLSRYEGVAPLLPPGAAAALLFAQFPLLLLEGLFEGRLAYDPARAKMPLWMRIDSRPVRWSFTLAFTYLTVVALQTWDISIGPIDPTPPESWPEIQRAAWFGMMSLGMFFPNYLASCSLLIPLLRGITAPLRLLPTAPGALLSLALGCGLGYGVLALIASDAVDGWLGSRSGLLERPEMLIGVTVAAVLGPLLLGAIRDRRARTGD